MLVEQIDHIGVQALQARLANFAGMGGLAVDARHPAIFDAKTELGGDHQAIALALDRLAQQLLIGARAIDLGRVEEGDAPLGGGIHDGERSVFIALITKRHRAKAQTGNFETGTTKTNMMHVRTLGDSGRLV